MWTQGISDRQNQYVWIIFSIKFDICCNNYSKNETISRLLCWIISCFESRFRRILNGRSTSRVELAFALTCNNGVCTSFITCNGCSKGAFVSISNTIGTANWIKHHWTSDHTWAFSSMSNFQIGIVTLSFSVKHAWIALTIYLRNIPFRIAFQNRKGVHVRSLLVWERTLEPWSYGSQNLTYRMSVHQYHKLRQASLDKRSCKVSLLEFEKPMQKVPLRVSFWFRVYLFRWKYKKKFFDTEERNRGVYIQGSDLCGQIFLLWKWFNHPVLQTRSDTWITS